MATVKPFAALRPNPPLAARICELPYDVLSSEEARHLAAGNPLSFFHVSKPEIDLSGSVNPYDASVYAQGKASFSKMISDGTLQQDATPHFYLYRQIMGSHAQLGLVAVASCAEYASNLIRKHELTRPDKEDDRVRHIEAMGAQTGPAFLTYPSDRQLDDCFRAQIVEPPDIDFTSADGVRHSSWTIRQPATHDFVKDRFQAIPALYIADGHHRSAAAARVAKSRAGAGSSAWFLSVLFPDNQVQILPYHRVLRDFHGRTWTELLSRLEKVFVIREPGEAVPRKKHEMGLYTRGQWRTVVFQPHLVEAQDPLDSLDVSLLQKHVLGPLFGIDNPRTSTQINFVGGIRGPAELERLVNGGEYACAFSMFPTGIGDLIAVAERGGLMPPKSTWFEPKLRDGMFSHLIG